VEPSELVARLHAWIASGAVPARLPAADLDEAFSFDNGTFRLGPPVAAEHATMQGAAGLVDVALLAEIVAGDSYVVVARARDPVTDFWHQCAWVCLLRDAKVFRLIVTISGQIPSLPYDGSVPLRATAD